MPYPRRVTKTAAAALIAALVAAPMLFVANYTAAEPLHDSQFAKVNGTLIMAREYAYAVRGAVRRKYYHGKIPAQEIARFQREVGDRLVERALLLAEADRRGISPEPAWVEERLKKAVKRMDEAKVEPSKRVDLLQQATVQLEALGKLAVLEREIRTVPPPTADDLRAFYRANPDKFTEPERVRISAILLKVAPSSATATWQAAHAEADTLVARLRGGADFAELARMHSADASAENGGDMGYLHRGMLGTPAQASVDKAEVGKITDPVVLLDGVAIFRVDERTPSRLLDFGAVQARVEELFTRSRSDQAWQGLLQGLRAQAVIEVNTRHYMPLPDDGAAKL